MASRLSDVTWQACERELPQLTPLDEGASSTTLLAGGICGTATWALAYPFDIIKTRAQVAPHLRHRWPPYCSTIPPAASGLAARGMRMHFPKPAPSWRARRRHFRPTFLPLSARWARSLGDSWPSAVSRRGCIADLARA